MQRMKELHPLVATFTIMGSRIDDSKKRQPIVSSDPPTFPGPLTIHLLSRSSGKPHFAQVTREIARTTTQERNWAEGKVNSTLAVTPEMLTSLIQGNEHLF